MQYTRAKNRLPNRNKQVKPAARTRQEGGKGGASAGIRTKAVGFVALYRESAAGQLLRRPVWPAISDIRPTPRQVQG